MAKHHTKDKGDLAVFKAKADLCEKGFTILQPETEHAPFDVVAYKDKRFLRIQVKYRKINKFGVFTVLLQSCWADKHGCHVKNIDREEIDYICIYCPNTSSCYYFDPKQFKHSATFRFEKPKRGQYYPCHYANDYLSLN